MAYTRHIVLCLVGLCCVGTMLLPQARAEGDLTAANFSVLQKRIQENPQDLEAYFTYAKMANALGLQNEAKRAYLHMLAVDPLLYRVKLDLGMLYLRTGQYLDAQHLFEEVLLTKPPKEVENNIKRVLDEVKKKQRKSNINASVLFAYNHDTDANSAAKSGNITLNDVSIPLEDPFRRQHDNQTSVAASLQYKQLLPHTDTSYINLGGTVYRADQAALDEQNIQAVILRLGPSVEIKPWHMALGLNGGYQYVELDGRSYLHVGSGELSAIYTHNDKLSFMSSFVVEERRFVNSPTVSTYSDRSGEAFQGKIGVNYLASQKDIISMSTFYRQENTKKTYYDNDQLGISGSYTRVFPHDIFANLLLEYKIALYDNPDPLISLTKTREEYEQVAGITFGKTFKHNITPTIGYQYRRIDSNIQNYEYTNHRITAGIGWNY